jgi:hypothetical protein
MAPRFLTILTGRNLPKIQQPREPEPSTEKLRVRRDRKALICGRKTG